MIYLFTFSFQFIHSCHAKLFDGKTCIQNEHCRSGSCTCGVCGSKLKIGSKCAMNDNCASNLCSPSEGHDHTLGCRGTCSTCTSDEDCKGGPCTCGVCGSKLKKGSKCSNNGNCESGFCAGVHTSFCQGMCTVKPKLPF